MGRPPLRVPRLAQPQLELFSGGRKGPTDRARLTPGQIAQISRTVSRTPEVMVKVTGGGTKIGAVRAHLTYINRHGRETILTDEGQRVQGKAALSGLVADWQLELSAGQYRRARAGRAPPRALKLVHHVVLSMPAPTAPDKVLAAAKKFGREKFGVEHRYAMVLHTDQRHPHVHLVVKAEGLSGRRLHIDKAMLRAWRGDFAQYLRELGVPANATARFERGRPGRSQHDVLLRARGRGAPNATRAQVLAVGQELLHGGLAADPARSKLLQTRQALKTQWLTTAEILDAQGEPALAAQVRSFVRQMPPVLTDRERIAVELMQRLAPRRAAAPASRPPPERDQERTR